MAAERPGPPASEPKSDAPDLARAEAAASDPGTVTTTDIRSMWPQVLDAVKNRRRVTWIILRENAQVHAFAENVLTLSVDNPGARESLGRGGSIDILREAVLEVLGIAPRIEAIASDAEAPSAAPPPRTPPRPEQPTPEAAVQQQEDAQGGTGSPNGTGTPNGTASPNGGAAAARQNIAALHTGPVAEEDDEATASRDDIDLDAEPMGTEELLTTRLGAELIGEEEPER
ncbi:MAG: hypothetical protein L0G22_12705 [Propionibacteriaceae bacterium]|nr:hypothetical protein [Propionibacteriaceae bacterium]